MNSTGGRTESRFTTENKTRSSSATAHDNPGPRPGRCTLIIEDDTFVGIGLKAHLEKLGHRVVGQASSSGEAIEMFRRHKPDLVLVDIRLDGADGIDLAGRLLAERSCPMIVVTAYGEAELINRAAVTGVFGYLIKPVSRESLAAQIAIAVQRFDEREKIRGDNQVLAQTLEARKFIEKAKGLLMKNLNVDEPAAHKWLQIESQKRRISACEMAKLVLNAAPQNAAPPNAAPPHGASPAAR